VKVIDHKTSTLAAQPPHTEQTDQGAQYLINGCKPVTQKERLEFAARMPMTPKRARSQKPCDIGLFDENSRNQMDLF